MLAIVVLAALNSMFTTSTSVSAAPVDTVAGTDSESETVPTLADPPVDAGAVEIITPQGEPLSSGGSSTLYSLRLPDGAACPGDSASGNWLVQSFLIPEGDDPGAIEYGVIGPKGTQFALFAFDTRPFVHQLTQVSSNAGDPGVIPLLPALTFSVFEPGYIPAGNYRIGIACTYYRATARYWDTEIVIEAQPDDVPAQLTWRAPGAAPFDPPSDGSTRRKLMIAGIVAALMAAAVLLWQSRGGSSSKESKDSQRPSATSPHRDTVSASKDSR